MFTKPFGNGSLPNYSLILFAFNKSIGGLPLSWIDNYSAADNCGPYA